MGRPYYRKKRSRFKDVRAVGASAIVPHVKGEDFAARHQRRLMTNLAARQRMEAFCKQQHITLDIYNDGHHWQFRRDFKLVEWWPSSAKCVANRKWGKGLHVHDFVQMQGILLREFRLL